MVRDTLSFEKALIALMMTGLMTVAGCSTRSKDRSPDWSRNRSAVEQTASVEAMAPGSQTETDALKLFEDFYEDYSYEAIEKGVRKLYAEDAWFGDPFHIVEGIDDIEHYFLVMAEPVKNCAFTVDSIQRSGSDYYARWTMVLESKAAKGEVITTIGMSHMRFNNSGRIIFQQDYWDSSAMLDRLPIVGYWTRMVKDRIEKGLEK
jgi:hypothetical protein